MEINKEDKITILLNLLNERYQSAHRIRERSFRMTLWILGLASSFCLDIGKRDFPLFEPEMDPHNSCSYSRLYHFLVFTLFGCHRQLEIAVNLAV